MSSGSDRTSLRYRFFYRFNKSRRIHYSRLRKRCVVNPRNNEPETIRYEIGVAENATEMRRFRIRAVYNKTRDDAVQEFHREIVSGTIRNSSFEPRHLEEIRVSNTSNKESKCIRHEWHNVIIATSHNYIKLLISSQSLHSRFTSKNVKVHRLCRFINHNNNII